MTTYTISTNVGSGIGTITNSSVQDSGASTTVHFTPHPGYYVNDVRVDNVRKGALPYLDIINITANHSIYVYFSFYSFLISASAGANGSVTPSTSSVRSGDNQSITIAPNTGYHVASITIDGSPILAVTSPYVAWDYVFSQVTTNHTLHVEFAAIYTPPVPPQETISSWAYTNIVPGIPAIIYPSAPVNVVATRTDSGTSVTWAGTDPANTSYFIVGRAFGSGGFNEIATTTEQFFGVYHEDVSQSVIYSIYAVSVLGVASQMVTSNTLDAFPAPAAVTIPQNVHAVHSGAGATVWWANINTPAYSSVYMSRNGGGSTFLGTTTGTSFSIPTVNPTDYIQFSITNTNPFYNWSSGNTSPLAYSNTIDPMPVAPSNVVAGTSNGIVVLTWTDNAGGLDNFEVQWSTGVGFVSLSSTTTGATTFSHLTASRSAPNTYRVRAVTMDGQTSGYVTSNSVWLASPPDTIWFGTEF